MADRILDPFHRALSELINEEIADTKDKLSIGAAVPLGDEKASVAEKYAWMVSRIQTLKDILGMCRDIETNQNSLGPRPAQVKVVQR